MRYFVEVEAPDDRRFQELGETGLDLFVGTADRKGLRVQALASMGDVERLVNLGYRVTVEEPSDARARAREIISFDEWLETVR
jgi:hypothetical protein